MTLTGYGVNRTYCIYYYLLLKKGIFREIVPVEAAIFILGFWICRLVAMQITENHGLVAKYDNFEYG